MDKEEDSFRMGVIVGLLVLCVVCGLVELGFFAVAWVTSDTHSCSFWGCSFESTEYESSYYSYSCIANESNNCSEFLKYGFT